MFRVSAAQLPDGCDAARPVSRQHGRYFAMYRQEQDVPAIIHDIYMHLAYIQDTQSDDQGTHCVGGK